MTDMTTEIVQTIPPELEKAEALANIDADGAHSIAARYAPSFIAFRTLADEARDILPDEPKKARAMRLAIRAVRVEAEKTRKSLKEDSLRRGKAIDGVYALLEYSLVPVEERMEEIEKAEERREAARKAALLETRRAELSPYCDTQHYALADMSEDAYQSLLTGQKAAKAAAEEAARKAEAERIAAEAAAAAERARIEAEREAERVRILAENARLAAEKAEADRKAAEIAEAARVEREEAEKEAARVKAEAEAAAKAAADALAAAEAKAAAEAAKVKAEADKREAAAQEEARKAKAEADRLAAVEAERVRVENERKALDAVFAKAAAAAPDKDKLAAFAAAVRALPVPTLATDAGKALQGEIVSQTDKFARWIEARSATL